MRARVQKWGNSLALRIPKSLAAETALDQGSEVNLSLENGRLVITPRPTPFYDLEDLVARIDPENLHTEIDTGPRVGSESW